MGLIIKNGVIYNGAESEPVVYSLDEREIGVWIDGKPVYMRVVDLGSDIQISYNSWTLTSVSLDGISRLISVSGLLASGNAYYGDLMAGNNTNKLQLQTPRNTSYVEVRYLIMKYTKTADTAGSGTWTPSGVKAEHYSTTEQVVGTWINNKPLYQRTLNIGTLTNDSNEHTYSHGISNIDEVPYIQAVTKSSEGTFYLISSIRPGVSGAGISIGCTASNIVYRNQWLSNPNPTYVTIRYTKTTT